MKHFPGRLARVFLSIFLVISISQTVLVAQNESTKSGKADETLEIFDINQDGKIDDNEISAVKTLYGDIPKFLEPYVFLTDKKTAMKILDTNKNNVLDGSEVEKAVQWVKDNPGIIQGRRGPGRGRFGGPGRGFGNQSGNQEARVGKIKVSPDAAEKYPQHPLYDTSILRTFFLTIDAEDWEKHMTALKGSDLEVGGDLVVDDQKIENVGLRFRGNTSFSSIGTNKKKSLNISIDASNKEARLYGYKTLELLNAHTDASFLRQTTFNNIANRYVPSPKTNFVHLVINGESWGIYVNVQQFNKDFLKEHWDNVDGIRIKVPANPRGGRALTYLGEDVEAYPWRLFAESLKKFTNAIEAGDFELADEYVDIDMCLWYMALENLFIDNDGYWVRASDFNIYVDPNGRIYPILRDANETFKQPGGPGFQRGSTQSGRFGISPYHGENDQNKILASGLLKDKNLRARYAAHYRTLANSWLVWENLEPTLRAYHRLIAPVVKTDSSKLYSFLAFENSIDGEMVESGGGPFGGSSVSFRNFTDERSISLLDFPELDHVDVVPASINHSQNKKRLTKDLPILGHKPINITVEIPRDKDIDSIWVYHSDSLRNPFHKQKMEKSAENTYTAEIDAPDSEILLYYFEFDSISSSGVTGFYPKEASMKPLERTIIFKDSHKDHPKGLIISEVMPDNESTAANKAGKYADWFIIENKTDSEILLNGFYMSDNVKKPKKWEFPRGLKIESKEKLRIWADNKISRDDEIHCNFKLSSKAETLVLVAPDILGNKIIDSISWQDIDADFLVISD